MTKGTMLRKQNRHYYQEKKSNSFNLDLWDGHGDKCTTYKL